MVDNFVSALSTADLEKLKVQYKDNESIVKMVTDELMARAEAIKAKAEAEAFTNKLMKLAKLPAPPETIHNVYLAWALVETPKEIPAGASEAQIAELKANPDKAYQWVVETNKGFKVTKADGSTATSKRAITVKKITGDKVTTIGNFQSASKAADFLKIEVGDDSATRVLAREGYILSPYDGTDYTK